jgi:hypothetical protein
LAESPYGSAVEQRMRRKEKKTMKRTRMTIWVAVLMFAMSYFLGAPHQVSAAPGMAEPIPGIIEPVPGPIEPIPGPGPIDVIPCLIPGQPGCPCGDGMVYDCASNCVDQATTEAWNDDSVCDDGTYGIDMMCPAFNYDGGDCGYACYPDLPNPNLIYVGSEDYTAGDQELTRYRVEVTNRDAFPDEMFAASPDLPPCGLNTNASRTWVDIYDNEGNKLMGFCAFSSSDSLGTFWFALPKDTPPPASVYIEMVDRQCNHTYTSDLAPIESCNGSCGGQSAAGCYCDDLCQEFGDCCPDYETLCDEPYTGIPLPAPGSYGNKVPGGESYPNQVDFSFDGVGGDVGVSYVAYDVDIAKEIEILINGQSVGYAPKTLNNAWGAKQMVTLPDAHVNDSATNTLTFNCTGNPPKSWKWGVKEVMYNIGSCAGSCGGQSWDGCYCDEVCEEAGDCCPDYKTLCDNSIPLPATGSYGNKVPGAESYPSQVDFSFDGVGGDVGISYVAYDVDIGKEIEILINGQSVGYAPKTVNNAWGAKQMVTLPDAHVNDSATNTLTFNCTGNPPKSWKWGVKEVFQATCAGSCGGQSDAGCYCDDLCQTFGDCCPDYEAVCD